MQLKYTSSKLIEYKLIEIYFIISKQIPYYNLLDFSCGDSQLLIEITGKLKSLDKKMAPFWMQCNMPHKSPFHNRRRKNVKSHQVPIVLFFFCPLDIVSETLQASTYCFHGLPFLFFHNFFLKIFYPSCSILSKHIHYCFVL